MTDLERTLREAYLTVKPLLRRSSSAVAAMTDEEQAGLLLVCYGSATGALAIAEKMPRGYRQNWPRLLDLLKACMEKPS